MGFLKRITHTRFGNYRNGFGIFWSNFLNFRNAFGNFWNTFWIFRFLCRVIHMTRSEQCSCFHPLNRYADGDHPHKVMLTDYTTLHYLPVPADVNDITFYHELEQA